MAAMAGEPKGRDPFEPSAATATMFLYGRGSTVICCRHDTLAVERRFSRHAEDVRLLAVDNQSEHGSGRLVVSYDAGQTAIVWDLLTGEELARFASYEPLTAAAWMRNGNVAFGNSQGNIILFEPATSEHLSARTLDQIRVTALAPAADCRTFAIGYQNGSLLIATLQPRFTILHNLSTARAPSPVVALAWHASASRQRTDMLASQTQDGDLRVWSVAKAHHSDDPAKVVRILRRTENYVEGPNWMAWSKNGRIIQYSDRQTVSWDVRTKHVTYDQIPTLDRVRGLAVYGPGAILFTLGHGGTVQQFDLNTPSRMIMNLCHHDSDMPPSPPVSVEERDAGGNSAAIGAITVTSSSDEDRAPDDGRGGGDIRDLLLLHSASASDRYDTSSPSSSRSGGSSSLDRYGGGGGGSRRPSAASRAQTDVTYISGSTSLRSHQSQQSHQQQQSHHYHQLQHHQPRDLHSTGTRSLASSSRSSAAAAAARARPSRLTRGELGRARTPSSSSGSEPRDLFQFTRARLSDLAYRLPAAASPPGHHGRLTNDDLRRQMLATIFGWTAEAEDLIRDERSRHPAGSSCRMLLSRWLGEEDVTEIDMVQNHSDNMTPSDWMLLALGSSGGGGASRALSPSSQQQQQLGRAYVQRLLGDGEVDAAATITVALGDFNDAIEIYISHRRYMEALILTCLAFPAVWERQAAIVRKWGEHAVQHGQQQLAIRCFACTDQESSEPWASPSALQLSFRPNDADRSVPLVMSPPLSPPNPDLLSPLSSARGNGASRPVGLKLITSFHGSGGTGAKTKFFDNGPTPIAAGITPIAESAISPAGLDPSTAFIRPSVHSRFNTPTTARPSDRFPSIGESLLSRENLELATAQQQQQRKQLASPGSTTDQSSLSLSLSSSVYKAESQLSSPDGGSGIMTTRTPEPRPGRVGGAPGSRDRDVKLQLQLQGQDSRGDVTSPTSSGGGGANRFHWPRRRGPGSASSSGVTGVTATTATTRSARSNLNAARSVEEHVTSLDPVKAGAAATAGRTPSQNSRGRRREPSREHDEAERTGDSPTEDRGRRPSDGAGWARSKTSPTSPIPMSPQEIMNLSSSQDENHQITATATRTPSRASSRRQGGGSSGGGSGEGRQDRSGSRPALRIDTRGRSAVREGASSAARSPSSPLPMSAHFQGSEDEADYLRAVEEQEKFRAKRSNSRAGDHSTAAATATAMLTAGPAPPRRQRSRSGGAPLTRASSTEHAGDLRRMKDERQRKKEAAARELEERRRSLAQRTQNAGLVDPATAAAAVESETRGEATGTGWDDDMDGQGGQTGLSPDPAPLSVAPSRSPSSSPPPPQQQQQRSMYARSGPAVGLPATPKAMRLILNPQAKGSSVGGILARQRSPEMPEAASASAASVPPKESPSPLVPIPAAAALQADTLTLLPQTVYQPPQPPPRSMSAPIPELTLPRRTSPGQHSTSGGTPAPLRLAAGQLIRRPSGGGPDVTSAATHERGPARGDRSPPVVILKELQHLAGLSLPPPPPPPPPMPHGYISSRPPFGIYHDDDDDDVVIETISPISEKQQQQRNIQDVAMVPHTVIQRPGSSNGTARGHSRGRSLASAAGAAGDSLASRLNKATTRLRSQSRTRREPAASREATQPSPYESIPPFTTISPVGGGVNTGLITGLHRNEMI